MSHVSKKVVSRLVASRNIAVKPPLGLSQSSVRSHHTVPSVLFPKITSWQDFLQWRKTYKENFDASEAKLYRSRTKVLKTIVGAIVSAGLAYALEGRIKERSEKLDLLEKIRTHVYEHRSEAQKILNNLSLDSLEVVPRLGTYTHASEDEIKEYAIIRQNLLDQLKSNKFLQERRERHMKDIAPFLMGEVKAQSEILQTELDEQYEELEVAYFISSALLHLKLKQCDQALKEIESVLNILQKVCQRENMEVVDLENSIQTLSKNDVGNSFYAQALVYSRIIQGKAYYIKAFYNKNSDLDDLKKSEDSFFKVSKLVLVAQAQPLALCYRGYPLAEEQNAKAISINQEAIKAAPDLPNAYDGFGYTIHMLYRKLEIDPLLEDEKKLLVAYKKELKNLNLLKMPLGLKDCTLQTLPKKLTELALAQYNKALSLNPRSTPAVLAHRGWLLLDMAKAETQQESQKLYEKAHEDFDCAIERSEDIYYPLARAGRGIASLKLGKDTDQTLEDLNIAYLFYRDCTNSPVSRRMVLEYLEDNQIKDKILSDFVLPIERVSK